jgi:hypothetical protein
LTLPAAYLDDLAKMPLQASVFASWYNRHSKVLESRCFLQAFRLTHGCVLNNFSWYPKGIKFFVKKSRRLTLTRSKKMLVIWIDGFRGMGKSFAKCPSFARAFSEPLAVYGSAIGRLSPFPV